jgi:predicted Rossmann fold nucleotide-binding protein DprA/Smf involved in DNA uptake
MTKEADKRLILSFLREDHAKLQQISQATELSRADVLAALEALESENRVWCNSGFWQLTTN